MGIALDRIQILSNVCSALDHRPLWYWVYSYLVLFVTSVTKKTGIARCYKRFGYTIQVFKMVAT